MGQLSQHVKARGSSGGTLGELVSSLLKEHNSQVMQESSDAPCGASLLAGLCLAGQPDSLRIS